MVRKTLAEAASGIIQGKNRAETDKTQEPFGAGKNQSGVMAPGQTGKPVDLGGQDVYDDKYEAIEQGQAAVKPANPPGSVGLDKGELRMPNIKKGDTYPGDGPKRPNVTDNGVVGADDPTSPPPKDHDGSDDPAEDLSSDSDEANLGIPDVEGVPEKVKAYVQKRTGVRKAVSEDIDAIFSGENLSEEFKEKARTIYEASIIAAATAVCEGIEAQYAELLEQVTEQLQEEMTEKVDDYLNYMVEEWVKDNEIAIESGLRAELAEDFIGGLKSLFTEHYMDIPEEKVQVVEELAAKVEELEASLNEQTARNIEMKKALSEQFRTNVLRQVSEGLTETQIAKLSSLAEGVDFTTADEFRDNLVTIRESYFPSKPVTQSKLEEEVSGDGFFDEEKKVVTEQLEPGIDLYVKAISKTTQR